MQACRINFWNGNLRITNTYHLYVFVIHKHKKSFAIAPISHLKSTLLSNIHLSLCGGHTLSSRMRSHFCSLPFFCGLSSHTNTCTNHGPLPPSYPSLPTSMFLPSTTAWHSHEVDGWASWPRSLHHDHATNYQRNFAFSSDDRGNLTTTWPDNHE